MTHLCGTIQCSAVQCGVVWCGVVKRRNNEWLQRHANAIVCLEISETIKFNFSHHLWYDKNQCGVA